MLTKDTNVWLQGGSWRLLGVQLLACLVTAAWAVVTTVIQLFLIEKTIGIRLTREEELQGCDFVEHGIGEETGDKEQGEEALQMESASAPDHLISSTDKRKGQVDVSSVTPSSFALTKGQHLKCQLFNSLR